LEIGQLLIISMLLPLLLATAIIAGFGILVMSLEANSALGQWILPSSELNNAYKQGYHESNVTMDEVKQRN
jgi:Ni/Fe-hydrogenase subunit HybB-like protein